MNLKKKASFQLNARTEMQHHHSLVLDDQPQDVVERLFEMMETWSPPDSGFEEKNYSDSELEENIANSDDAREDLAPLRNPSIADETQESNDEAQLAKSDSNSDGESNDSDSQVVAQNTEDEVTMM